MAKVLDRGASLHASPSWSAGSSEKSSQGHKHDSLPEAQPEAAPAPIPEVSLKRALAVSFLAASSFLALATVRLGGQGLYYDELHQATAAFVYCGQPPEQFCALMIRGVPILNMNYSAAIKTGIYGLYLRCTNADFGVISWRLLGIAGTALGIFAFGVIARKGLCLGGLVLFLLLLLTDTTVLLGVRHDWGPVALALALRLLFVAVWIRWNATESPSLAVCLGALATLAVFEKLSSVALCGPLALAALGMCIRGRPLHCLACVGGAILGAVPLLLANAYSYCKLGSLISLANVESARVLSLSGFWEFLGHYSSLGEGVQVRSFILGQLARFRGERYLLACLGVLVALLAARRYLQGRRPSPMLAMGLGYLAIAGGLYLLPNPTSIHHWIIGTPFQYAALALALTNCLGVSAMSGPPDKVLRVLLLGTVGIMLVNRLPTSYAVEQGLRRGAASPVWDSSLTRFGEAIAPKLQNSALIAADWGIGTQPYCFAGGRSHRVYQPFFGTEQSVPDLQRIVEDSGCNIFYVAARLPPTQVNPKGTERILRNVSCLPGWKEMPAEAELQGFRAVQVRKFVRTE